MVKRVGPQVPKLNYGPPQNYCGFLYSNFYMETVEDVLELGLKICCSADSRNCLKIAIATKLLNSYIAVSSKGGIARKAAFGSLAVLTATSMCFPKEAVDLTEEGYNKLKQAVKDTGISL